jgi:hypothetical protein
MALPSVHSFVLWFDRWLSDYVKFVLQAVNDAVKWHATVCFP